MSLLTIVQDAMIQAGLRSPSNVFANTDPTVKMFMRFAQVEGDELMRSFDWPGIKKLSTMTGDGSSVTFTLPTDFHRWLPGSALYKDDSPVIPLTMVTDEEMRQHKEAQANPIYPVWRMIQGMVEFYPAPPSGDIYKGEYRSQYWILDEDGTTAKARWAADTDTSSIPEELLTLGCVWRFKHSRGFDYAEDFRSYQLAKISEMSAKTGRPNIVLSSGYGGKITSDPQVVV